jgi:hypothetical protein
VLGFAACGGGGGGLGGAGDAIQESHERGCAKIFSCRDSFPGTDADFTAAFGTDEADCVSMQIDPTDPNTDPDAYDTAEEAGTIVFNSDDASVCLDSFDDITCEQLWGGTIPDSPPECESAIEGQVAAGGACVLDEECAAGSCVDAVCG